MAAIAAGFAAINLLPASSHSAGVDDALAKDVVARTADVAGGAGNGILHIDMLVTQTSAKRPATCTIASRAGHS